MKNSSEKILVKKLWLINIFFQNNFGGSKNWDSTHICANVESEKFVSCKNIGQKIVDMENFGPKKILIPKQILGPKQLRVPKMLAQNND